MRKMGLPEVLVVSSLLMAGACGAEDADDDDDSAADGAALPGAPGTTTTGTAATTGGGISTGTSASSNPDAPNPVAPGTQFEECAEVGAVAQNEYTPADIIFLIDNSPSMRDEIEWTRQNMNAFSQTIAARGLDPHIVVISCLPGDCDGHPNSNGICIDPPLGLGQCPTADSNPPSYLHIDVRMPSVKLLQRALDTYDQWHSMLRPTALTHFVAISDDGEDQTAEQFHQALGSLNPPLAAYVFHGIFSMLGKEEACAVSSSEPCCTYAAPDGEGVTYKDLVAATGGVGADLCAQDFDPVFVQFAEAVISRAELSCTWEIPLPPAGQTLDADLINVEFTSGGSTTYFGYVQTPAECDAFENGWYYDDPLNPSRVLLCPSTCGSVQGQVSAELEIKFGCDTQYALPPL